MHKSTAFRLVATLEGHRLVEQAGDRGKYRLGVGVLRLAGATTARLDVVQEARPVCRQLAADTGETVNITVLSESSALYLDQVAGSSALQPHNWVGQHIPLHATSNGKVLLSELLDADCSDRLLPHAAVRSPPRPSPAGPSCARSWTWSASRATRWRSTSSRSGLTAVAAPIRNARGDVIASMSVSGPTFRLGRAPRRGRSGRLIESALEVSLRLGWGHRRSRHPRVSP